MAAIKEEAQNEIRRYLLGQLDDTDEERLEFRLLTEPLFVEEFDTIVDELTDQYVHDELDGGERIRFEQYFLKTKERQVKAKFSSALIEHASATRGTKVDPVETPSLLDRLIAFLSPQSMAFKFATTVAVVVLAVGIAYVAYRGSSTPQTFASIELSISQADRADGAQRKSLQLAPGTDAAKLILNLPDGSPQYQSYRVELVTRERATTTPLEVTEQTSRTVTAVAPAELLKRGTYAIHLTGVKADGSAERVAGTYYLTIE